MGIKACRAIYRFEEGMAPGSFVAMRLGCTCDMLDNALGRGIEVSTIVPIFNIDTECPIHANPTRTERAVEAVRLGAI